jgi:hypothetical protein
MRVFPALLLLCLLLTTIAPVSTVSPGVVKTIGPVQTQTTRPVFSPVKTTTITTTEISEEDRLGYIFIESDPAGAEIELSVGAEQVHTNWTTPFSSPVMAGGTVYPYIIVLKKPGYKVYSEQVAVQPKQTYSIHAVLIPLTPTPTRPQSAPPAQAGIMTTPVPDTTAHPSVTASASHSTSSGGQVATTAPEIGTLSVTTNPAGAMIFVDSIAAGASPATIPGLSSGVHNLTMTMPGYAELITQVNIVDGQIMDYSTTLIPATEPTKAKSPGFELIIAGLAVAGIILLKRSA